MIKQFLITVSSSMVVLGILTFSIIFANDYFAFKNIMRNTYDTPWYNNSWVKQPYTLYQLSKHEGIIYETKNAVGSTWVVKETNIQGKNFWTVLIEIPKKEVKND